VSVLRSSDVSEPGERSSGKPPALTRPASVVLRPTGLLVGSAVALFAGVFLLALFVKRLLQYFPALGQTGATLLEPPTRATWEAIAIGVGALLALTAPRFGRHTFGAIERAFSRFAVHRTHAIVAAAAFPVIVRLALLPLIPIPQPWVADEFGHLLLADTFAAGRITNPTHPMWRHFETLYVFHQPTYTSQYPIAQGLLLAVPVALHAHPWFGVCLSVALMCAALCWMLQGWLPPKWALLGALLAGARWALITAWINSYWGGAAGAIGGALLLGALPRLIQFDQTQRGPMSEGRTPINRTMAALMAGIGVLVLSQSRPFEGLLLCLPVVGLLLARLLSKPLENVRVLATLICVSTVAAAGLLYYDWRVTGNAIQTPYQLHQQIYGTPQNLLWSAPVMDAARVKQQRDIWDNFEWQLGLFQEQSSWRGFAKAMEDKLSSLWEFYFQVILSVPLLLLPFALRRNRIRFLLFVTLFVLLADFLLYPFFFPHYAAPLSGALLVLILQGARCLRAVRWPRQSPQRVGSALFRWTLATAGVLSCSLLMLGGILCPACVSTGVTARSRIAEELKQQGGKHLVFVRYSETHDVHHPWIYNSAVIDESSVIWARELDQESTAELLRNYPDRVAWLVNADDPNPELISYADKDRPRISAILNAAGRGPFFKEGVTPGSIVTLFGNNFVASGESHDCLIRAPQGPVPSHTPQIVLPGFDGSRPGVVIPSFEDPVPAMRMEQPSADLGGVFSLALGASAVADPKTDPKTPGSPQMLEVRFGDLPATALCVAKSGDVESVTVLVPANLAGDSINIIVRSGEFESRPKTFLVLPANPGILQMSQGGRRSAILLHPGGGLVTPGNPARRGEILRIFVTGIGALSANRPQFPFIIGVNNRGAPVRGVNCAGCRGGITELQFEVPQESPSGAEIVLSAAVVVNGTPIYSNASTFAIQ
jgi:uncharacterized protein (TIGR03437 family)